MTPGERIKILRSKNDISQKQLSRDLGYKTYTTVSKWESDASLPPGRELKRLAEYFQVSTDYILGLDNYPNESYLNQDEELNHLNYLASYQTPSNTEDNTLRTLKVPKYILKENKNNYFVLNVYTDSVNRIIPSGNKVVIQDFSKSKECRLKTGDVVLLNKNNELALKYYRKTDTMIYLEHRSYLEGFNTSSYTKEEFETVNVIGKVVYTFRNFT